MALYDEKASSEAKQETKEESKPTEPSSQSTAPDAQRSTRDKINPAAFEQDIAKHKQGLNDPDVPPFQNPLHHNNPDMDKIFAQDFATPEEFEAAKLPLPPFEGGPPPAYLAEIADEIVNLTMLEMNELTNKIADHFGFDESMLSPQGGAEEADDAAEAAPVVEEKSVFDLKLVGFDEKAKIKVIKEVRAIAGLGLKEAKELVEGAPKVVQKDLKKEVAEELKAKLEEAGAKVEIV
jgi:large subunit ribosomal protein L7/L12